MNNLLSWSAFLSTAVSILLAILVLLIMITVHEFGHYIVGKIFKFKINEFAIGMGPAIFKRTNKKTGEVFSVRALPLGGYCAFEGENEDSESPDSFNKKQPYKRILVLIAGAFMNIIVGVFVLMLSIGIYGQLLIKTYDIVPLSDAQYSSAYSLSNDDVILKIDGKSIYLSSDILDALNSKKKGDVVSVNVKMASGEKVTRKVRLRNDVNVKNLTDVMPAFKALGVATIVEVSNVSSDLNFLKGKYLLRLNDSEEYSNCTRILTASDFISALKATPNGSTLKFYYNDNGEKKLGEITVKEDLSQLNDSQVLKSVGVLQTKELLKYSTQNTHFGFFETIERGFKYSISVAGTIFRTLGELLTGKLGISAVGGPITTISITSTAIKQGGFNYFLEIMGFIGINLGIFNLLPIPALDGAHVVFTTIEWIRKKPVSRKVEGIIHAVGLIVLLGFCVLVDLLQFI